jgi:hypothetical protein
MIWRYHVYPFNHSQHSGRSPTLAYQTTESEINDFSRQGWEVVATMPDGHNSGHSNRGTLVFKRPTGVR